MTCYLIKIKNKTLKENILDTIIARFTKTHQKSSYLLFKYKIVCC
jgi:hypothetical protein